MGVSVYSQIHYFERHRPSDSFNGGADIEVWDFSRDVGLSHAKDSAFLSAIAGVRGPEGFQPKFSPRGLPPGNWLRRENENGAELDGWLYFSEIEAALRHRDVEFGELADSTKRMLRVVKALADELGDDQVRVVFQISF